MSDLVAEPLFESRYTRGSGVGLQGCTVLGRRYRPDVLPYQRAAVEHWLASTSDGKASVGYGAEDRWFTGVWRSSSGSLFVTDAKGRVHRHPNASPGLPTDGWTIDELHVPLDGIWGLDGDCVFAWGGTLEGRFPMFRFNGSTWCEIENPGFDVRDVHGTNATHLIAVGLHGALARFDGRVWSREAVPVAQTLTSVFVVSEDEAYVTGANGSLLEGSSYGWGKIAQSPAPEAFPLRSVAFWKGELYVAAHGFGLLKRDGRSHRLLTVSDAFRPVWLDAREHLLIVCDEVIAETDDGQTFRELGRSEILRARAGRALLDFS